MTKAQERIQQELRRATRGGVTISQAAVPRDTFLAGYLSALHVAKRLAE